MKKSKICEYGIFGSFGAIIISELFFEGEGFVVILIIALLCVFGVMYYSKLNQ